MLVCAKVTAKGARTGERHRAKLWFQFRDQRKGEERERKRQALNIASAYSGESSPFKVKSAPGVSAFASRDSAEYRRKRKREETLARAIGGASATLALRSGFAGGRGWRQLVAAAAANWSPRALSFYPLHLRTQSLLRLPA